MPVKIDLITGFLGAGKTTFLLRYARYLLAQGQKLGILVYDHGAMNVDLPLLNGLRGENCELVPETRGAIIVIGSALNENEISRLLTGRIPEHRIL